MISDKNRSYYIGASDVPFILRPWSTKTFEKWYLQKLGYISNDFESTAMMAGTAYERPVLESLGLPDMEYDRQIIDGRLRVNLDGNTPDAIYEAKTYKLENGFKVPKHYRDQVNVQMYATGIRTAYIVVYGLEADDYRNFYRDIDPVRRSLHPIKYDPEFIELYLERFNYMSYCLDMGRFPVEEGLIEWKAKADLSKPLLTT